jgi:hypothetical protein
MATSTAEPTATLSAAEVWENVEVHGRFFDDQIWKGEIHVIGDVVIEGGATLTIEPGTIIYIDADNDVENLIDYEPWLASGLNLTNSEVDGVVVGEPFRDERNKITIQIFGTLNAIGLPDEPIVFTSDSPQPGPFDWNLMQIWNGVLKHSIVEFHRIVDICNTVVSFSTIRNSGEQGIGTAGSDCSAVIEYSNLSYAGHELLYILGSPIIRWNILGPSPAGNNGVGTGGIGIIVKIGSPEIYDNVISGTHLGIVLHPNAVNAVVENNLYLHNTTDFVSCAEHQSDEYPECQN